MTHTLHRRGCAESLQEDFVVLTNTSRVNREKTRPLLAKIAAMAFDVGPSNMGSSKLRANQALGLDREEFLKGIATATSYAACFSSQEELKQMLARVKEADLGISVTVSGLIDVVIPLAQQLGFKPHTINLSLGILGNTERLPEEDVLEMATMCGHGMVSANLVRKAFEDVASGNKTPREASVMMGEPCVCGIFNLDRSDKILGRRS